MMKNKKPISILITSLLAICMIFIMFSFWFVTDTINESRQTSISNMQTSMEQSKKAVIQKIKGDLEILDALTIFISAMDETENDVLMALINEVNNRNSFIRLGLIEMDGTGCLVDINGTVYKNENFKKEPVILDALMGKIGISDTMKDRFSNEYIYTYAVPIMKDGTIIGALTATNRSELLREIIDGASLYEASYSHLIKADGRYLIRSNTVYANQEINSIDEKISGSGSEYEEFLLNLKDRQTGTYTYQADQEEILLMYMPMEIKDWMLVSFVPTERLTENNYRIIFGICIIIILALCIFAFFAYQLYRIDHQNVNHLKYLAYTDSLLGCANLAKMLEDGEQLLKKESNHRYTIWYCDISKFKYYNDINGYDAGDALLMKLSKLFAGDKQCVMYCRVGADDFAGLLCDLSEAQVIEWFNALCQQFDKHELDGWHGNYLKLIAGFYIFNGRDEKLPLQSLINRANMAHKSVNSAQLNYAFYSEAYRQRVLAENEIEANMEVALSNHQFKVYLQPKVDIQHNDKIISAEALVRWQDEHGDLVYPDTFIPLFERNGFIIKLDRYMFTSVCAWMQKWLSEGNPKVLVSVNVSKISLLCSDFLEFYKETKAFYQIPDHVLILEFTESIALDHDEAFAEDVLSLKEAGFICSMDDFGSGYSSLNILKNLMIDEVKLDLVFFRQGTSVERSQTIVRNVLHLAKDLKIKTVAEGIESYEQVAFLKQYGCDMIQGYYFYKPMSLEAFERIYHENN